MQSEPSANEIVAQVKRLSRLQMGQLTEDEQRIIWDAKIKHVNAFFQRAQARSIRYEQIQAQFDSLRDADPERHQSELEHLVKELDVLEAEQESDSY